MAQSKAIFNQIVFRLRAVYGEQEANTMAYQLLETFKITKIDILTGRDVCFDPYEELEEKLDRLCRHEPLQYVMGIQDFYGRTFFVGPNVLIPRPETEHLVDAVLAWVHQEKLHALTGVDIGVGSGCIAITLTLALSGAIFYGLDVSEAALEQARKNAIHHHAQVHLSQYDVLQDPLPMTDIDLVVSNPPYIPQREKAHLSRHVLREPAIALFVPNDRPLLFYESIAQRSQTGLRKGGLLAVEVHADWGKEVANLFCRVGYTKVQLLPDYSGRDRVVTALR